MWLGLRRPWTQVNATSNAEVALALLDILLHPTAYLEDTALRLTASTPRAAPGGKAWVQRIEQISANAASLLRSLFLAKHNDASGVVVL